MTRADSGAWPADAAVVNGSVRADVAVIGAGAAGLYASACLPDHLKVVVVDKAAPTEASGSSPWAQGGIAAAVTDEDSPRAHAQDTLAASDGLADPAAAWILANEAPRHVAHLVAHGATFDRQGEGVDAPLEPAREGGQQFARSVRHGDASGAELIRVLRHLAAPKVSRLTGVVDRLAVNQSGRVTGAWVVADGRWIRLHSRVTILATGGCGGLFAATTNPVHATGDGLAIAWSAGAHVRDVEFVQFHPTALAIGQGHRFLLTEALRGAGATLHDADGRRFMTSVHPAAELAPRHVVAGAILDLPDGVAWLDATNLGAEVLASEFPTMLAATASFGLDLRSERMPVSPAAHYHMGGVWSDLDARTSRPGLLAAGEAACTGVHGANRMAGNSLSEALVFGARAAASAAADCALTPDDLDEVDERATSEPAGLAWDGPDDSANTLDWLRHRMLNDAGPRRSGARLAALVQDLDGQLARFRHQSKRAAAARSDGSPATIVPSSDDIGLRHALMAARLIARSALLRTESRGGHHRIDFPHREPSWDDVHLDVASVRPGDEDAIQAVR
ncbi:MAG: FAD-binding protein [Nitriliruptoraceae bacterium]